jgi:CheY-like chemotaxis protein
MQKVLIVDDDADDRNLIKESLDQCVVPIKINEVTDGSEVMSFLEKCGTSSLPSLILLDLNMPIMNGFDVLVDLKKHPKFQSIPVYVFTTSNSIRDKTHCIQLGAVEVYVKPASYAAWVSVLCPLVDNRKIA